MACRHAHDGFRWVDPPGRLEFLESRDRGGAFWFYEDSLENCKISLSLKDFRIGYSFGSSLRFLDGLEDFWPVDGGSDSDCSCECLRIVNRTDLVLSSFDRLCDWRGFLCLDSYHSWPSLCNR